MSDPIFRLTASARHVAVTVTLSLAAYTDVRCPQCNRLVLAIPGTVVVTARIPRDNADRAGLGPVALCKRCSSLVEAIVLRLPPAA